jgi:integral membrane sensor domain MASE1
VSPPATNRSNRRIAIGVAVAASYYAAAKLGFQVAFVAEQVTTVWAPTGIALAALLLWGRSLWPAVWLGAFVANATAEAPMWTAAAVASGNTLEAIAAVTILRRLPHFDPTLQRVRDVAAFIGVGALLSTAIAATVGVTTLCAAAVQPWHRYPQLWAEWWFGDALGALVVGPLILTMARPPSPWSRREWVEAALLVLGAAATTQIVFGHVLGAAIGSHPLEYVIFPFVIAAAVRLGPPATALVVFGASGLTIWNTLRGAGPFAGSEAHESLVLLQSFMGVLAATGLVLAAAIAERRTSERRRAAAHAVSEALGSAANLTEAVPTILKEICSNLEWQLGAFWLVDRHTERLRCEAVWSGDSNHTGEFIEGSKATVFATGVGLPGRVWASGEPAWIPDVVHDANFPRAVIAEKAGVHGAFAFPISLTGEVVGVIEIFNRRILTYCRRCRPWVVRSGNSLVGSEWKRRSWCSRRTRAPFSKPPSTPSSVWIIRV